MVLLVVRNSVRPSPSNVRTRPRGVLITRLAMLQPDSSTSLTLQWSQYSTCTGWCMLQGYWYDRTDHYVQASTDQGGAIFWSEVLP